MSAFEEVKAGRLGDRFVELLYELIGQELRRFPALQDRAGRSDAAWEFAADFFVERGQRVVAGAAAETHDEESLGRYLRRSVRNWLVDRARSHGRGPLARRVEELLVEEECFEQLPGGGGRGGGRWQLAGTGGEAWGGSVDDLVRAAYAVPGVRSVRWSSDSRRPPLAERRGLVAVLRAVLEAAGGGMRVVDLVEVMARRFPAAVDPVLSYFGDPETDGLSAVLAEPGPSPEEAVIAAEDDADIGMRALEVYNQLQPWERSVVGVIDDLAVVQGRLRCGRSTAYARIKKLKALLAELAGSEEQGRRVVAEVMQLCRP